MSIVVTTKPTVDPVTLGEAKFQLNITHAADDDYITALISTACSSVEKKTNTFVMPQVVTAFLDAFPDEDDPLNVWPIRSIASIKYDDESNAEQTVSSDDYYQDIYVLGGRVEPVDCWPFAKRKPNAVRIAVNAGYADSETVPADLKHAILLLVAHLYANREPVAVGVTVEDIPYSIDYLLSAYRMPV